MPAKIAINGFGRIGRTFFKLAFERPELEVHCVNDLTDPKSLAYLLKYDSVYGRYNHPVEAGEGVLKVNGKEIKVLAEKEPEKLPWKNLGIDIVVESTGFFASYEKAAKHLTAGAKHVVISAPAEGEVPHVLVGANDDQFVSLASKITSDASCTTNATVPVAAIMGQNPGIAKAAMITVHGYTSSQNLVDGPNKDPRRGRAAAQNIVPGSLVDFTFLAKRKTSVEEINDIFKNAALEPRWQGILKVTEEPLVSTDIIGDPYPSIVDLSLTRVVDGDLVKVFAWYDNEWAYSATLVEHVIRIGRYLLKVI
ncbi:type I glyceraldehyde-3-phosphate dehydrogenase [Candidatus Azambacteria bacterium]|nr:type I glyceraldehyde-3-phosphate dehydrogenase [Candidatus Azambacteria bacterium]